MRFHTANTTIRKRSSEMPPLKKHESQIRIGPATTASVRSSALVPAQPGPTRLPSGRPGQSHWRGTSGMGGGSAAFELRSMDCTLDPCSRRASSTSTKTEPSPEATDLTLSCRAACPSCTWRRSLLMRTRAGMDEPCLAERAEWAAEGVDKVAEFVEPSSELRAELSCSREPRPLAFTGRAPLALSSASRSASGGCGSGPRPAASAPPASELPAAAPVLPGGDALVPAEGLRSASASAACSVSLEFPAGSAMAFSPGSPRISQEESCLNSAMGFPG
mmetsp:Transcript_97551/g.291348  ORF Transcript_97551/g.291348 Transcript_97551/m.291348 type:complete len:276 (+) Transcript_97551:352-1179(+)